MRIRTAMGAGTTAAESCLTQTAPEGMKFSFCDRDGGHPMQLTALGMGSAGTPHWSPDGHRIASMPMRRVSGTSTQSMPKAAKRR